MPRKAVVITQRVTAFELFHMFGRLAAPFFVSDGADRTNPKGGRPTTCSRRVSAVNLEGGSSLGNTTRVSVEFADETPGRLFNLDDEVEVHALQLGDDITIAGAAPSLEV